MTRTLQACLAIAFLTLAAKAVGSYAAYAIARDVHAAATGDEMLRLSLAGTAARDYFRARGMEASYLATTLHLQVVLLAVAAMAYAAAANGGRRAATFLALLVLVAVPVDLPLGLVHLVHTKAGTALALPPEMTWSWLPRNPFGILRRLAEERSGGWLSPEGALASVFFLVLMTPGLLAASAVLAELRHGRAEAREWEPATRVAAA